MTIFKKITKTICTIFVIIFIGIILFIVGIECFSLIVRYNSRSDSLVYSYKMVRSKDLIGMDYSQCCNYLNDVEDFRFLYESNSSGIINDINYSFYREYNVGTAINKSERLRTYVLKVYFNEDSVVFAQVEEEKA